MKLKADFGAIALIAILCAVIGLFIFSLFDFLSSKPVRTDESSPQMNRMSRMSLTAFDRQLGTELMDKDRDGRCDVCGMDVEQCLDSGQIECNMGGNAKTGVLGSQHIHADFKIFINGKPINFADNNYYMKSSFIHVDNQQNKEDASGVLHMHATGVPLSMFFDSLEIKLPNTIKLYVNGKLNPEGLGYVFKDLDKLLLTDATDQSTIQKQLSTITDYAKEHLKKEEKL